MREILFRGKGIDGNWYYGVPLVFTEDYVCMTAPHTYNKKVEANTIGQFTGLIDKNGAKVFEGDIGKSIDGLFLVRWSEEKSAFVMNFYDYPYEELYLEEMWEDSEIIGNINDNVELLNRTPQNDEVRI